MTRDLATNDQIETLLCTEGGVDHDFRAYSYLRFNEPWISWRCVWCHGVACGDYFEDDPCMEIYHHRGPHRSLLGLEWPIGGWRPDVQLST